MSNSKGKVAVITGATGGIGFEVAKRLGKDGFTVVLNGIDDEGGAKRIKELTAEGITAEYYGFDVTKEDEVTANINKIGKKYGKIDVLVNNAGGLGGRSRFEEMTTEFYRFVMALNLSKKRRSSYYNQLYLHCRLECRRTWSRNLWNIQSGCSCHY